MSSILAGDVGGTKTELAIFRTSGEHLQTIHEERYASQDFASLTAIIRRFLDGVPAPSLTAACFGVPGPVVDGRCLTTNLPWALDERALAREIPVPRALLVNDLAAMGWGVLGLARGELVALQEGTPRPGHKALVAAGTGLGQALMVWDGARHLVVSSEGGHVDFAPRDEREAKLRAFLASEFGHVSNERVLSGPGLFNIYRYLRGGRGLPEPAWLADQIAREDSSVAVSAAGLAGTDPVCVETLDLFASIYGAVAGNVALSVLAVGGVYIGGGIAPKIRRKLVDGTFVRAFRDKGRMATLLESFPVYLTLSERAPLLGAARLASRLEASAA